MAEIIPDTQSTQQALETVVIAVSNKGVIYGSLGSFLAWLSDSGGTALVAVTVAIAGLLVTSFFQYRRDIREKKDYEQRERRAQLEHELRMRADEPHIITSSTELEEQ